LLKNRKTRIDLNKKNQVIDVETADSRLNWLYKIGGQAPKKVIDPGRKVRGITNISYAIIEVVQAL
jgi:hypothetical protein